MPSFQQSIDIEAGPEQVWAVLGDVTSVDQWIPGITAVTRTDYGRVCVFEDGHSQREQILDYDAAARSYRYVIEGAPLPVSENTGSFAVEQHGDGSRVVWHSSFTPLDPAAEAQLAALWEPFLPMVLANLKNLIQKS
jgi:carbon monoxide dehydrogenase subunit G